MTDPSTRRSIDAPNGATAPEKSWRVPGDSSGVMVGAVQSAIEALHLKSGADKQAIGPPQNSQNLKCADVATQIKSFL